MKIVFLDALTLGDVDFERFKRFGEVEIYQTTPKDKTLERVKDADIVVTNKVVIDKEIMDNSGIKFIQIAATGMNNVDLEYARKKGILVKNVAGRVFYKFRGSADFCVGARAFEQGMLF